MFNIADAVVNITANTVGVVSGLKFAKLAATGFGAALKTALSPVALLLGAGAALTGLLKGKLLAVVETIADQVSTALQPAFDALATALEWCAGVVGSLGGMLSSYLAPYLEIVEQHLGSFWEIIQTVASTIGGVLMPVLKLWYDSVTGLVALLQKAGEYILNLVASTGAWTESTTGVSLSFESLKGYAKSAFDFIKGAIEEVVFRIQNWDVSLQLAGLALQRGFAVVANTVIDAFNKAWEAIQYFWNNFGSIMESTINWAVETFWTLVEKIKAAFNSAWEYIKSLGQVDIEADFSKVASAGASTAEAIAQGFANIIDVDKIDGKIAALQSKLESRRPAWSEDLANFEDKAKGVVASIADKALAISDGINEEATAATGGIADAQKEAEGSGAKSGLTAAFDKIQQGLLSGGKDDKLVSVNEKQLTVLEQIAGKVGESSGGIAVLGI